MSIFIVAVGILELIAVGNGEVSFRIDLTFDDEPYERAFFPSWRTITQRVDHFNPVDLRTWEMRYLNSSQFFQKGGPMVIFVGGEWSINQAQIMSGQAFLLTEETSGYLFYTEHRYYGDSFPTEDLSSENLRYLSVDQSLADLAYFIEYKKRTIPGLENSKVVVIGGSYAGSMAVWARMKYPNLVDVAYASSAPFQAKADFYEYLEVANDNIGLVSQTCLNTIRDGIIQIEEKLKTEEGIDYVSNQIGACKRIKNEEPHRSYFFYRIGLAFSGTSQHPDYQDLIQKQCNYLKYFDGSPLEKLTSYFRYMDTCLPDYDRMIELEKPSTIISGSMERQWKYQTCTEYGYFVTTTSQKQLFGKSFDLDLYLRICQDLFGERYDENVLNTGIHRTNTFYGSLTPDVTKVLFVHGSADPWHRLGIVKSLNPLAPAIFINGTSHCADLHADQPYDLPQLTEARFNIRQIIKGWL